jgi:hypothetical protein
MALDQAVSLVLNQVAILRRWRGTPNRTTPTARNAVGVVVHNLDAAKQVLAVPDTGD